MANQFDTEMWVSTNMVRFDERLFETNMRTDYQIKKMWGEIKNLEKSQSRLLRLPFLCAIIIAQFGVIAYLCLARTT